MGVTAISAGVAAACGSDDGHPDGGVVGTVATDGGHVVGSVIGDAAQDAVVGPGPLGVIAAEAGPDVSVDAPADAADAAADAADSASDG